MTLFEIDAELKAVMENAIDSETGELLNPELIEELSLARDEKIKGIALAYKNSLSDYEQLKAQKEAFEAREKQAKRKAESLKGYLAYALNGETFVAPEVAVSYRKSKAVHIEDDVILPEEYQIITTTTKPDKTKLKKALESGLELAGVTIVENRNIQIK